MPQSSKPTPTPGSAAAPTERPARRRTDASSPGERRGAARSVDERSKTRNDSPLESLGKAISSPIIEAAEEDEKTR